MARPGDLPLIAPMLAAPARQLPADEERWSAEFKWDGARTLAYIVAGAVVLRSRGGLDVTATYPELARALAAAVPRRSLILDGEAVALDGPRPSFARLQRRMHVSRPGSSLVTAVPVTYMVFDLLYEAGRLVTSRPYEQRTARLGELGIESPGVSVPPAFPRDAAAVLAASRDLGIEGIVLKRLTSAYQPGRRSLDWLKIRHMAAEDLLIGGWLPGSGYRSALAGAVLVGRTGPAGLEYAGQVGSGFAEAERRQLTARLEQIEQPASPFAAGPPASITRRARWVRPVFTAEVTYAELTPGGRLRHPVWRGLRAG